MIEFIKNWFKASPPTPAELLRREAVAIAEADRRARWVKVKPEVEAAVKLEASSGRCYLNLNGNHGGADLYYRGRPGYDWAVSQGFIVTGINGAWSYWKQLIEVAEAKGSIPGSKVVAVIESPVSKHEYGCADCGCTEFHDGEDCPVSGRTYQEIVEPVKCKHCGGRLGAQDPGDVCGICKHMV